MGVIKSKIVFIKFLVLELAFIVEFCLGLESFPSYTACNDTDLENAGLYFEERNGFRYWNHCGFPNPRISATTCGRDARFGDVYDLCNVDSLFSSEELTTLDALLAQIASETSHQCTLQGVKYNTNVAVVALRNVRVAYLGSTDDVCVNNCGQYFPELVNSSQATRAEIQFAVDVFSQRLADSYSASLCGSTVVVVYWHEQHFFGTGVPVKLQNKLKWPEVLEIRDRAQNLHFNLGNYTSGLVYVLNEYKTQLKDTAPAYWLLCINFGIIVLVLSLMVWVYLIDTGSSSYFEDRKVFEFLSILFRIVTGVIFIEILIRFMLLLDRSISWWHIIIIGAALAVAFSVCVFYVVFK